MKNSQLLACPPVAPVLAGVACLARVVCLVSLAPLAGCATSASWERGAYSEGGVSFHVAELPATWTRVSLRGGGVAFHHRDGGTIYLGGDCLGSDDVPLDVLINHLVIGLEARTERSRQELTLDGRAALRSRIDGTLDGVPVALDLVVLKKNGCSYDLHLVAALSSYEARRPDFDRLVAGFTNERTAPAP